MKGRRQDHQVSTVMMIGMLIGWSAAAAGEADHNSKGSTQPAPAQAAASNAAAPQPAAPPASESPLDKVKAQLNGTRWTIQLNPLASGAAEKEKAKPQKDTVTFDGNKVSSEQLSKAGYGASNYTLTIGDDAVPVWETMMQKEGAGVVFWRGELHGGTVRGVFSKHPTEGDHQDFSFSGTEQGGKSIDAGVAPKPSTPPAATSSAAPAAPASAPSAVKPQAASSQPPAKKKGIFGR